MPRKAGVAKSHIEKPEHASYARLDAFARGQICALRAVGTPRERICALVLKKDGSPPSIRAVDAVVDKKKIEPEWRGEDSSGGGRAFELSKVEVKALLALVYAERCKAIVTAPYCQKRLKFLRRVTAHTVRRYLHRAGLAWLRRRRKSWVPEAAKAKRMSHCRWIRRQVQRHLNRWAYTDGTTFYLARGPTEHAQQQRASLGHSVWRMANGKDGLFDANIGPSMYAKSQGMPVKVWGLFAAGHLEYYVLPPDGQRTTNMNAEVYEKLVSDRFAIWRTKCFGDNRRATLVQDHEQCLWSEECQAAIDKAGFDLLATHPKHSPDLNAIENWWARLRKRLNDTAPKEQESRPAFIVRLRRVVNWVNNNCKDEGKHICENQKERAKDILFLKGAKCKW
jgi:hypothetical protein